MSRFIDEDGGDDIHVDRLCAWCWERRRHAHFPPDGDEGLRRHFAIGCPCPCVAHDILIDLGGGRTRGDDE